MNSELMCKCLDLNDKLKDSTEYKELVKAEKDMQEDEQVCLLSYKKDMRILDLEDAMKHYKENSIEVLKAQKALSEATYELNNNELVKIYKEKLETLNELYKKIEDILFKGIKD